MNTTFKQFWVGWSLRRWLILAISLFFIIQGIIARDVLAGLLGAIFLYQALTNSGCILSRSCNVPAGKVHEQADPTGTKEVHFTEITED